MPMKFRCPTCNELFSASEDMAGAQITCPMCFAKFELPREDEPTPPSKEQLGGRGIHAKSDSASTQRTAKSDRTMHPQGDQEPVESVGLPLAVSFRRPDVGDRNELDMTPMVDVTFLLLIFFMVTAAFGLQKSYDIPAPDDTRPSTSVVTLEELESDPQFIIVRVDEYDTFHVSAAAWEIEQEAPSKPDLLVKLRQARASGSPAATHLLVMANEEATNGKVVAALDAGAAVGMEDVKLMTMPAEQ